MRLVLDTNVLISSCVKPEGLEAQVVGMVLEGSALLCVTPEVWAEYEEVFSRPKFARFSGGPLERLKMVAARFTAVERVAAAGDEDDIGFWNAHRPRLPNT